MYLSQLTSKEHQHWSQMNLKLNPSSTSIVAEVPAVSNCLLIKIITLDKSFSLPESQCSHLEKKLLLPVTQVVGRSEEIHLTYSISCYDY